MILTNDTGFPAAWTMGFQRDGRELLIIVVKATYTIPTHSEPPQRMERQVPLVTADQFSGEPGQSAPLFETDFAHHKPACDVLLIGSAYAPRGEPVGRVPVGLRIGSMAKRFCVVGPRVWYKSMLGIKATSPQPFTALPISYDVAFGGTDRTQEEQGKVETFLANPVGKGYWRSHARIEHQPLPNTEEIDRAVDDPEGSFSPMAFSPIGRSWTPRLDYAGTYDEEWMQNEAPLWPRDFDHRYFHAAPPDQILPYPRGGEPVVLHNLTPDGNRAFQLPVQPMPVTFIPYKGREVTLQANMDTLVLEPDSARFSITWRANLALGKSVFDVRETVVGQTSGALRRARAFPGKRYYHDLAELVRDRRKRGARG